MLSITAFIRGRIPHLEPKYGDIGLSQGADTKRELMHSNWEFFRYFDLSFELKDDAIIAYSSENLQVKRNIFLRWEKFANLKKGEYSSK